MQNTVQRHDLGTATAATSFFRGLGGAVGAAVLGAVFASSLGAPTSVSPHHFSPRVHTDIIGAVQSVFVVAAPLAALGLIVVLALPEIPLRTGQTRAAPAAAGTDAPRKATAT